MGLRSFLSRLIFEKWLKWPSAQTLGEQLKGEAVENVRAHNERRSGKCEKCGSDKLLDAISGSDGLFCSPHHFYRCPKCGHEQEELHYKWEWRVSEEALNERRIVDDGQGRYRYTILTRTQSNVVGFILMVACLLGTLFGGASLMMIIEGAVSSILATIIAFSFMGVGVALLLVIAYLFIR